MRKLHNSQFKRYAVFIAVFFLSLLAAEEILAQFVRRGGARADVRGTSRRTARRVNRRHDGFYGGRGYYGGGGYYAGAAAVGAVATAAVLTSLPGGCSPYNNYYNCGGTYYEPTMQGTEVVYVQVEVDD